MQLFSLILFALISCNANDKNNHNAKDLIVDVESNGNLERKYYTPQKHIMSSILFNQKKSKLVLTDSVVFQYDSLGRFKDIEEYEFSGISYQKIVASVEGEYYANLFSSVNSCPDFSALKLSFLLINELGDMCNITNSTLPDGQDVKKLEKVYIEGQTRTLVYDSLNAKFRNLSLDFQSFFDNQNLNRIEILLQNGYLSKENYFYENGILTRTYVYEDEKVKDIEIEAKYKDGLIKKNNRHYSYSYSDK